MEFSKILNADLHSSKQQVTQTEKDRKRKINKEASQTDGSEGIQSIET